MSAPGYVREVRQRHRLETAKCKHCRAISCPPRLVCKACRNREFETLQLEKTGRLMTFTVIHAAPSPFAHQAPYALGIIEMPPGARLISQIVDCDFRELKIGIQLHPEFRKVLEDGEAGIIEYGYKAVPDRP